MGPEKGTEEYDNQVKQIFTVIFRAKPTAAELDSMLLLYILDETYSREAIAEAKGQLLNKRREECSHKI